MDPAALLDHALFRLTPTRTRCDLLAVQHRAAPSSAPERIASGLLQPFLTHLRAARDQIPKGGYSFTLRPPAVPAQWFTKATLERFVRFVATPEILERVVTIEKEIVQIEDSIQREDIAAAGDSGNGKKPSGAFKGNEDPGKNEVAEEENSKICLLRVLESRKMMLLKEQGMAYARASVAGFDKRNIEDLESFADVFGADRLREACISFKELCKEKEQDKLWMDELAALEASRAAQLSYMGASGITLASEMSNDGQQNGADDSTKAPLSNGTGSVPWNSGPYMYNFQNPGMPGAAPFPGYAFPFPGMQMVPPYSGYPENFHWSHRGDEKDIDGARFRGMSEKLHRSAETTRSSRDAYSENESSNSGSESDEHHASTDVDTSKRSQRQKKSKKKSSRTVVIRNINYISSKGRHAEDGSSDHSSAHDDLIDGDSLRRQVEDIVGSFDKHQHSTRHQSKNKGEKRNLGGANVLKDNEDNGLTEDEDFSRASKEKTGGGWDAFQNILMREDSHSDDAIHTNTDIMTGKYQLQDEIAKGAKPKKHTPDAVDPLIDGKMVPLYSGNNGMENFEYTENNGRSIKRTQNAGEDFLVADGMGLERGSHQALSNIVEESSRIRARRDGDWFFVAGSNGKLDKEASSDHNIFEGEQIARAGSNHEKKEKRLDAAIDDSFITPSRVSEVQQQPFSLWQTDVNIIAEIATGGSNGDVNHSTETRKSEFHEPEELQLMFERHSEVDVRASWNPEIEYTVDATHTIVEGAKPVVEASITENDKKTPGSKAAKPKTQPPPKAGLLNKSVTKNKLEALSRPKTLSTLSRKGSTLSKMEREEVERKRIEELRMEREKRIAQRSATMGNTGAAKLNGTEKKTTVGKTPAAQASKQHGFGYAAKFSQTKGVAN